jgi:hypothetical protein
MSFAPQHRKLPLAQAQPFATAEGVLVLNGPAGGLRTADLGIALCPLPIRSFVQRGIPDAGSLWSQAAWAAWAALPFPQIVACAALHRGLSSICVYCTCIV